MAVRRSTNDNTIRYDATCMTVAAIWIPVALLAKLVADYRHDLLLASFFTASIFGAIGAAFSIITRVEAFEMKPCQQSNMNYWMSGIRVSIGIIGGVMLFLLERTLVQPDSKEQLLSSIWGAAATFGFIGGFSERLVKTLLRRTEDAIAPRSGTPVQEVRRLEDGLPRIGRRKQGLLKIAPWPPVPPAASSTSSQR